MMGADALEAAKVPPCRPAKKKKLPGIKMENI